MQPRTYSRLPILLTLAIAACSTPAPILNYQLITRSRLVCCRSMQFETAEFAKTEPVVGSDTSVTVRLEEGRIGGDCSAGAEVPIVVANGSERDVFIPFSHELDGSRVKLYPWRSWIDSAGHPIRLARQIQYGDLLEYPNARLRFFRLRAQRQVRLTGWISGAWLCTPPSDLYEGYLDAELDPAFYAQRSRGVRTSKWGADSLVSPVGLRYDVVYTGLEFLNYLPVSDRRWNGARDSTVIEFDVPQEPAEFVNASQHVASSNVVKLVIDLPPAKPAQGR